MRIGLKQFNKQKVFATATFVRYGNSYNKSHAGKRLEEKSFRLLFRDLIIKDKEKNVLVGHIWFAHSKTFKQTGLLEKGDTIEIFGEVQKYTKRVQGKIIYDYELVPQRASINK